MTFFILVILFELIKSTELLNNPLRWICNPAAQSPSSAGFVILRHNLKKNHISFNFLHFFLTSSKWNKELSKTSKKIRPIILR